MRARDVLSSDVVTVRENVPLLDAVKLLINAGASALPVVDAQGARGRHAERVRRHPTYPRG